MAVAGLGHKDGYVAGSVADAGHVEAPPLEFGRERAALL